MKQTVNFRLDQQTITALNMLEKKLHTTKTAIVEKALKLYAKKELTHEYTLLEFAGIISDTESSKMLKKIATNKHNKNIKIEL